MLAWRSRTRVGSATLRIELSTTITSRLRQSTPRINQRRSKASLSRSTVRRHHRDPLRRALITRRLRLVIGHPTEAIRNATVSYWNEADVTPARARPARAGTARSPRPGGPASPCSPTASAEGQRDRREHAVHDLEPDRRVLPGLDHDEADPHVDRPDAGDDQQRALAAGHTAEPNCASWSRSLRSPLLTRTGAARTGRRATRPFPPPTGRTPIRFADATTQPAAATAARHASMHRLRRRRHRQPQRGRRDLALRVQHALEDRRVRFDEARLHDRQQRLGMRAPVVELAREPALDHLDEPRPCTRATTR